MIDWSLNLSTWADLYVPQCPEWGLQCWQTMTLLLIQLLLQAGTSSSSANAPATTIPAKPDKPIFTLKQMSMIGKTFNYFYIVLSFVAGPQNVKMSWLSEWWSSSVHRKVKLILISVSAERMCAERVEQVRAEYDQILQQKLSEQVCTLKSWIFIAQ